MRVFLGGIESQLGVAIAKKLVEAGHSVTALTRFDTSRETLKRSGVNPRVGEISDAASQRELDKSDAAIDAEVPFAFLSKRIILSKLRPLVLKAAFEGSSRLLIATSDSMLLGDTGPVPASESARLRPPPRYKWLRRVEAEILQARAMCGVIIRPALEVFPDLSDAIEGCISLALRFKQGKYISSGTNRWSAVHLEDLANLYCLALKKATPGVLHGSSENFSMKELAISIHRGLGLRGNPSSLPLDEAKRITPAAAFLVSNHAISGELARKTLGWNPREASILSFVEHEAFVSRPGSAWLRQSTSRRA